MPAAPHAPKELIVIHQPLGLAELGSVFNADAPFTACRLCGRIYQTESDLAALTIGVDNGRPRRNRWARLHRARYHTDNEVSALAQSGCAFTPEAAHVLSSYGIFPTGNMSEEIMDAMATAPRAPKDDPEGSQ